MPKVKKHCSLIKGGASGNQERLRNFQKLPGRPNVFRSNKTEVAKTGHAWVCTRSPVYMLWLLAWCFSETPSSER